MNKIIAQCFYKFGGKPAKASNTPMPPTPANGVPVRYTSGLKKNSSAAQEFIDVLPGPSQVAAAPTGYSCARLSRKVPCVRRSCAFLAMNAPFTISWLPQSVYAVALDVGVQVSIVPPVAPFGCAI